MKNTIRIISIGIVLGFAAGCSRQEPQSTTNAPHQVVIVASPFLKDPQTVLVDLTTWLTHEAGCEVHFFDGWTGTEITQFKVPEVAYFRESAVAERIAEPLQKLIAWNQQSVSEPNRAGTGALALLRVLQRIAGNYPAPERLIILGSPVYQSPSDSRDDFFVGTYRTPSFGCLRATNSTFSALGLERSLAGTRAYFFFPHVETSWPSDYENRLRRFYGAFFKSRGAVLVSFTPDMTSGLQRVDGGISTALDDIELSPDMGPSQMIGTGEADSPMSQSHTNSKVKVTTNEISAPAIASVTPLLAPSLTNSNSRPATVTAVPATVTDKSPTSPIEFRIVEPGTFIEIRYPIGPGDASLHVRPYPGAEELSASDCATPDGWYYEAFDTSKMEYVKWVYLPAGCDPRQTVVWLNYSAGFGRLEGSLRWITPEGETTLPFLFASLDGGDAARTHEWRRRGSLRWLRVNLLDVTGPQVRALSIRPQ